MDSISYWRGLQLVMMSSTEWDCWQGWDVVTAWWVVPTWGPLVGVARAETCTSYPKPFEHAGCIQRSTVLASMCPLSWTYDWLDAIGVDSPDEQLERQARSSSH